MKVLRGINSHKKTASTMQIHLENIDTEASVERNLKLAVTTVLLVLPHSSLCLCENPH